MYFHQRENSVDNDTFNVIVYDNIEYGAHFHKSYEVVYVISGEVCCRIGGVSTTLSSGEWGLCLPNELHSYHTEKESQMFVCVFSCDHVRAFDKEMKNKRGDSFRFVCDPVTEAFVKSNLVDRLVDDPYLQKAALYALCSQWRSSVNIVERDDKRSSLFSAILDYVSENYSRNITVAELAETLGYDYHYISRTFHRQFTMSFADLVNTYRVEHACGLLESSEDTILHIAFDSGFQSVRTFNQVFKQRTGLTPMEYRQKQK